jgi:diacylglycerol kinase (ATP)
MRDHHHSLAVQAPDFAPELIPDARSTIRRALLIANPRSRSGSGAVTAEAALMAAGLEVTVVTTQSRHEVSALIESHADAVDCVVAAGGDGTMNAVCDGLMATGLPLGILPMGTANDLARTLAIPTDLNTAARIIAAGHETRIDIGTVNGHPFFNVASIGLSADLAHALTPQRKRRFGRFAYALTALQILLSARPFRAMIATQSGVTRAKTLQIAVGNGRYYGGGMAVESGATITDGKLDLYSLELSGVWKLLLLARSFRHGAHGLWQEVRTEKCVSFEVRTRRPRPVNTDGDLTTFTPARFEIRPKAVRVFVPVGHDISLA